MDGPQPSSFEEAWADDKVTSIPLSHLSIEVGHAYMDELERGPEALIDHLRKLRPWLEAAQAAELRRLPTARISTCFLIDDYFGSRHEAQPVLDLIRRASEAAEVRIDYLARESGCADADGIPLARLVEGRLVDDPAPHTDGSRASAVTVGWLCNGERSPSTDVGQAMTISPPWRPPRENGARNHSVFLDVELWDGSGVDRRWSCPFLASVWQLMRLGMLRYDNASVVRPVPWKGDAYTSWSEVPPVLVLSARAAPFAAYRTLSVMSSRLLPVEHAVRTILEQVALDDRLCQMIVERGRSDGVLVSREIVDRIGYIFLGPDDV